MDYYKIWGQIQEMPGRRFLLTAAATPMTSGRPASFSKVLGDRVDAKLVLRRLMQQLEHEVMSRGDRVVSVRGMWTPLLGKFREWNHRERIDGYRAVDG